MPSTGSSRSPGRDQPDKPAAGAHHLCPSFAPRAPGRGVVFGIVAGTAERPEVIPLEKPEPVTEEVFKLAAPHHPSEIFRIAAPCVEGGCKNFGNGVCHLAKAVLRGPETAEDLPYCRIRSECVWWHQEGKAACLRCPQVVTNNPVSLAIRNEMRR
ncbi:MAG: hypothetical protein QOH06_4120 [Acidobacteriota bacterium]|nr:hypothetical protein [Acidobacteriota bacterium]